MWRRALWRAAVRPGLSGDLVGSAPGTVADRTGPGTGSFGPAKSTRPVVTGTLVRPCRRPVGSGCCRNPTKVTTQRPGASGDLTVRPAQRQPAAPCWDALMVAPAKALPRGRLRALRSRAGAASRASPPLRFPLELFPVPGGSRKDGKRRRTWLLGLPANKLGRLLPELRQWLSGFRGCKRPSSSPPVPNAATPNSATAPGDTGGPGLCRRGCHLGATGQLAAGTQPIPPARCSPGSPVIWLRPRLRRRPCGEPEPSQSRQGPKGG